MDRFERAGQAFAELCRVMAKLRGPGGCPWDREQTLATLKPYLIEEAYETIDAIDAGTVDAHREELGDLLLQIVFQAEITQEQGGFAVADVAQAIHDKLVRRHPHVFGDAPATTAAGVHANWEAIKATERPKGKGRLQSIPRALPALLRAMRMGEKAAAVGFDWNHPDEVVAKVKEELRELEEAMAEGLVDSGPIVEEMGDLLFAIVNLSRRLHVDAEAALQRASDKFKRRFEYIEQALEGENRQVQGTSAAELDQLWEAAKAEERGQRR
jgi:tetrapyrrole methylase family protein / MazG family protein